MTLAPEDDPLAVALGANAAWSETDHVLIGLPSFGLGEITLSHYADRIGALEHRFLYSLLLPGRVPGCELVYLCSTHPGDDVIDYLVSLAPEAWRARIRARTHIVVVPDATPRPLAQKLLERPDLIEVLRKLITGRTALIEPWNVTEHEVSVAEALGIPLNGTPPELWALGFKSACRRTFREADVALPYGHEDLSSLDDVRRAIEDIRQARPDAPGVVVKHDNSVSGDGNAVIRFAKGPVDSQLAALPEWYVAALADGGIVEELVSGDGFSSPSAQIDILPGGAVRLLTTHEQVLGGADSQVYLGCIFPADRSYAALLANAALKAGAVLAARGVLGRCGVDFAVVRKDGAWQAHALEVNLRKSGTTHPFTALRNLVPGQYVPAEGFWIADSGARRVYYATDNLQDDAWRALTPADCIRAIRDAGLEFDARDARGVVLHMLSCLKVDGRCGLVAIAEDEAVARGMAELVAEAIGRQRTGERGA